MTHNIKNERVERALGELRAAFIDATVHAQDAFALVKYVEQQAARIAELEAMLVKANDAWMALSQTHSAAEPLHKFALIRDRNYEGEGLSLWTWNGENYSGADGDCLSPDADGTLDGYTVEWLTDHQLEQRLNADAKDAERYRWLRNEHFPTADNPPLAQVVWKELDDRHGSLWANMIDGNDLDHAIDAAIAASTEKGDAA